MRAGELGTTSLEWEIEDALKRAGFEVRRAASLEEAGPEELTLELEVVRLPSAYPDDLSSVVFEAKLSLGKRMVLEKLYGRPANQGASTDATAFETQDRALQRVARELAQDLVAWCREHSGASL